MRNEEKHALRRELRRARTQMGHQGRLAAGQTINRLLKRYIKKGRKIGVYWPIGNELRLDGFVRAAQKRGAKLYLPYIEPRSRRMWFTPYPESGMERERIRGRAKLNVPQFAGRKIRVHGLSVLLVPLVGIDREGYRLGQAGGYYDATLSAMKYRLQAKTVGVGFACQLVGTLPREAHDRPLCGFVSEAGILCF
ncbi:TPA: 5-formyltetrahydrofolate cyclo-ligase [Neisseria meningitidis]|uniref:5-formyltetrahydrofolate cyclo-ligase n=1 Tax=Neisseria meningitidis TaxID=487 RepID=UPI00027C9117|nr:5-formyltetrahydrofolate cyclo-ligase [Neisseria meningitidis]EJU75498.1 5-formyltetrahydrofolate cyclo-ligase [Neisseria meningitidis NM3081]